MPRPVRSRSSASSPCTTSAASSRRCRRAARSRAACCRGSASRSWRSASSIPTTGTVVNAQPRGLQAADARRLPGDRGRVHRQARSARIDARPQGPRRAADRADRARDRERRLPRDRRARAHVADHAPPLPRGARRMSAYVRPGTLDEALALLDAPDAHAARRRHRPRAAAEPRQGGRHARRRARAARRRDRAQGRRARDRRGDARGRRRRRRASSPSATPRSRRRPGSAASPQLRNQGTVAGNLAQHVRCWYFRHPDLTCWLAGGDTCYAQIGDHRKHGLEAGDCISVAPSDLAGALLALDASVHVTGPGGRRSLPIAELYARPSEEHRSSLQLARGELIAAVELPAAARRLRLRARRRARGLVVRARGHRGRALRRHAAPGRDRRHERAAPARPRRSARRSARPRADRLEARARGRAVRARARPRRVAIIHAWPPTTSR